MRFFRRKKRKHPAIKIGNKLFSNFINERDYKSAAAVVFWTALKVGGVKGIMSALDDANSFIKRKSMRRGL